MIDKIGNYVALFGVCCLLFVLGYSSCQDAAYYRVQPHALGLSLERGKQLCEENHEFGYQCKRVKCYEVKFRDSEKTDEPIFLNHTEYLRRQIDIDVSYKDISCLDIFKYDPLP